MRISCPKCKHQFETTAETVKKGASCPECGATIRSRKKKVSSSSAQHKTSVDTPTEKLTRNKSQTKKRKRKRRPVDAPAAKPAELPSDEKKTMPIWMVGLACFAVLVVSGLGVFIMQSGTGLFTESPDARTSHEGFVKSIKMEHGNLVVSPELPTELVSWQGTFQELKTRGKVVEAKISLADPPIPHPVVVEFYIDKTKMKEWLTVPKGTAIQFQGTIGKNVAVVSVNYERGMNGQSFKTLNDMKITNSNSGRFSDIFRLTFPGAVTEFWFSLNDVSLVDYTPAESTESDANIAKFLNIQRAITNLDENNHLVSISCGKQLDLATALPNIVNLKHLKTFRIVAADFNDNHLKQLTQCKSIEELWLSKCKVTVNGLRKLSEFPNLKNLVITNSILITDGVVPTLESLKQLKLINVSNTRLTRDGIDRLEQAFPNSIVISDKTGNEGWQQSIPVEVDAKISHVAFSPDASTLYTVQNEQKNTVCSYLLDGSSTPIKHDYPGPVLALITKILPEKLLVAYQMEEEDKKILRIDQFPGGKTVYELPGDLIKLSPDQKTFLVTKKEFMGFANALHDTPTGEKVLDLQRSKKSYADLSDYSFTADSTGLIRASFGRSGSARLLDITNPKVWKHIEDFSLSRGYMRKPPIPIGDKYYALVGDVGLFVYYGRGANRRKPIKTEFRADDAVYSPTTGKLIVYEDEASIRVVDPVELSVTGTIPNDLRLFHFVLSNDGRYIKANPLSANHSVVVWNVESFEKVAEISGGRISSFSADSKKLAVFDDVKNKIVITSLEE